LEDQEKDKVYGPKKNSQGIIKLGTEGIQFKNNTIIMKENSYPLTQGLGFYCVPDIQCNTPIMI